MRDSVLQRKQARIVMLLSDELHISPESALDLFYTSHTCELLSNPETGMQLMSDGYIVEDILAELRSQESSVKKNNGL